MKDKLKNVMYFETEELLNEVADLISAGKSVVVLTELYLGNGRWKLSEYKYKMLVPTTDNRGNLYSTDVFEHVEDAVAGEYGIYRFTRQNATKIVLSLDADLEESRYGFGYTKEKWGQVPLSTLT